MAVDKQLMMALSKRPDTDDAYATTKGQKNTFKGRNPDVTRKDAPDGGPDNGDDVGDGHYAAAKEMMGHFQSGDHKALAKSLHSFYKMCQ